MQGFFSSFEVLFLCCSVFPVNSGVFPVNSGVFPVNSGVLKKLTAR
jgi:hypothetical protein